MFLLKQFRALRILLSSIWVAFGEKCALGPATDFVVVPALGPSLLDHVAQRIALY